MRFIAFTAQYAQHEYDPLSPDIGRLDLDVQAEVLRGAETPDYFSTRPTTDLQEILRDAKTLPLEKLLNTGAVTIDLEHGRIGRDIFWKGSFAKDTLIGWEEIVSADRGERCIHAIDAPDTLNQPRWIPGDVIVNYSVRTMKVDAF